MAFQNGTPKAVTTAGTAEAIVTGSKLVSALGIQASRSNTGVVYVGGSAVTTGHSGLVALGTIGFTVNAAAGPMAYIDLADVYVNADNATDGVDYWYLDATAPA